MDDRPHVKAISNLTIGFHRRPAGLDDMLRNIRVLEAAERPVKGPGGRLPLPAPQWDGLVPGLYASHVDLHPLLSQFEAAAASWPDHPAAVQIASQPLDRIGLNLRTVADLRETDRSKQELMETERFVRQIAAECDGLVFDHVAVSATTLKQKRETRLDLADIRQFVSIHAVRHLGRYWLHTHGLCKFAHPELEWHLPDGEDSRVAANIVNGLAGFLVDCADDPEPEGRWASEDGRVQLEIRRSAGPIHGGQDEVPALRIELLRESGVLTPQHGASLPIRKEYFYGHPG